MSSSTTGGTATAPQKPSTLQHTLASQCGGAASTILLYPVDVVRMRYMSQDGTPWRQHNGQTYHHVWRSFQVIYQQEGGLRPFFRGCHVSVLGTVCAWGIYMYTYRSLCSVVDAILGPANGKETQVGTESASLFASLEGLLRRYGLSIVASCVSAVMCNPIWLLKTRMQLEDTSARAAAAAAAGGGVIGVGERQYRTFRGGLVHTVRTTGVRSLWRGVSAQMLLSVPNAFNLPTYDAVKGCILRWQAGADPAIPAAATLSPLQVLVCSTVTKVVIAVFSHPIMVLKVRLQDQRARVGDVRYESLLQSAVTTWRQTGLRGMYRGMVPSLLQTVPRSALMFVFYEQFLSLFQRLS